MREITEYKLAKKIMKQNFIGVDELNGIERIKFDISDEILNIPFSKETLEKKKEDYILILGRSKTREGNPVTIRFLREIFGKNPDINEPCFYNQDWYDHENFIDIPMKDEWYLIRKKLYKDSRALQPQELIYKYVFPSAIACTYTFFMVWLTTGVKLWYHDFVWCSDTDHNGDRIYVGRYSDEVGINKNGFNIHRHLALKSCYGCIDLNE